MAYRATLTNYEVLIPSADTRKRLPAEWNLYRAAIDKIFRAADLYNEGMEHVETLADVETLVIGTKSNIAEIIEDIRTVQDCLMKRVRTHRVETEELVVSISSILYALAEAFQLLLYDPKELLHAEQASRKSVSALLHKINK
jgi:hypothetical protein